MSRDRHPWVSLFSSGSSLVALLVALGGCASKATGESSIEPLPSTSLPAESQKVADDTGAGGDDGSGRMPKWLKTKTVELRKEAGDEPIHVSKFRYKGRQVYFVPSRCCDVPAEVYSLEGEMLCSPEGGFSGAGDGRCPEFMDAAVPLGVVWEYRPESPPEPSKAQAAPPKPSRSTKSGAVKPAPEAPSAPQ